MPRHYRLEPPYCAASLVARAAIDYTAARQARAYCRASSVGPMKLAFLCNAFVQFAGVLDVILKFTIPLG